MDQSAESGATMESFEELLNNYYDFDEPERGDIRDAEILMVDSFEIVVDLGVKRDGIVPAADIERLDPTFVKKLRVGDVVPVYVLNPNDKDGNLLVSLNLGRQASDWERAAELLESGELADVTLTGYNQGGALVQFGEMEGFIPNSHLVDVDSSLRGDEMRAAYEAIMGNTVNVKVIEVNQRRRRLILSQREAQREWRTQQKSELIKALNEGDIITGKVTGIRDFGIFVDLGGADGLVHVSELAWHRVPHPSDVVKINDEVTVYVLELDRDNQRIALSLRRTYPDPWDVVLGTYEIGQIVEGAVSNVVDFGAFVVLPDGIEGLLHVTEMADGSLSEPHSYVKRGDTVKMEVVSIEPERKRIGFTQKGLELSQPEDDDSQIRGQVAAAEDRSTETRLSLPGLLEQETDDK